MRFVKEGLTLLSEFIHPTSGKKGFSRKFKFRELHNGHLQMLCGQVPINSCYWGTPQHLVAVHRDSLS
jgi:hypothetical protein